MPATGAAVPEPAAPARSPETEKLLAYLLFLVNMSGGQIRGVLAGRDERRITDALRHAGSDFPALGLLSPIGSFIDGHLFIAPYLGGHGHLGRERQKTRLLRRSLFPGKAERLAVGVFVDEMDEIHGVGTMDRNLQRLADKPRDNRLQLIQCGPGDGGGAIRLRPLATVPMPLYAGHTLGIPSLLDVLDHVAEAGYDALPVATPRPLGPAALIDGSTLGIPIVGAYHTEFGAHAAVLSGDTMVAEIVEVLIGGFSRRCAVVAVSSASTALALEARGYQIGRFEVLKNGVDTRLFNPAHRDEARHLALSFDRPILVPDRRAMAELRQTVGDEWVRIDDGALDGRTLHGAMAWATATARDPTRLLPIHHLDWDEIARQTVDPYDVVRRCSEAREGSGSVRRQDPGSG